MKRILFIAFLSISTVLFSQDPANHDDILRSNFVGSWTHIRSTYPSGNSTDYYQEFDFYEDGTGICYRIEQTDTVSLVVHWRIEEGKVYLYSLTPDGKLIHGDTIFLSHLDEEQFFGDKVFGPAELRKTCLYKRKPKPIV